METHPQPSYGHYRCVQLARYLINNECGRHEAMRFNQAGQATDFGTDTDDLIRWCDTPSDGPLAATRSGSTLGIWWVGASRAVRGQRLNPYGGP